MATVKRCFVFILFFVTLSLLSFNIYGGEHQGKKSTSGTAVSAAAPGRTPVFPSMLPPGKKVPIDNDHYIIYGFDKKPKLGTIIMKVEIYTRDGNKDTSFEILADSGMPSMKGAHETGEQPLQVSKKGAYLLPVNIVMPGDWEIRITIKKDGKVIFRGSHQFDV